MAALANPSKDINLKVAEAIQDDVNKGIVRIDSSFMQETGVKSGDIVEIEGERKTVAMVDRSYPGDIGLNIIRMDGIIRRNAKTGIGEMVKVRRASIKEAKRVVIAPARKGFVIKASPSFFKQGLLGRAVVKGDIVSLGGARQRRTAMSHNPFFEDIFNIFDDESIAAAGFGFGDIKFIVADANPKQAVVITESTQVDFNPEAIEVAEEKVPDISYEDIGGLDKEIQKIREMVELPLKHPEIFERLGIEAPKGVLLHGPPGTGKTLLAKAVANETNSHFILINGPEIMSKFYGESEQNIRKKFDEAEKNAPSIIFIDEIDAIATKREETHGEVERRVVAQLLALMDGLKSRGKVVVIAASNIPNELDPALRRPGRFDREIELGVPGVEGRLNILKIHTRNMPLEGSWYDDIAAEELIKKREKISKNLPEKVDSTTKQINKVEQEINDLKQQLLDLEKKKKGADESLSGKIINLIAHRKHDIEIKKEELESLKKENSKLYIHKEKLEILKDKLNDKRFLDIIIKNSKEIERIKEIWGQEDPRNSFLDVTKGKFFDEVRMVIADLIELNILDNNFYKDVREKGVIRDREDIAKITHGFVGADLAALCKEAAMIVLRKILPDLKLKEEGAISKELLERLRVSKDDFRESLRVVRPSAMREVLVEIPNVKWTDIGGLENVKQELIEAVEWPLKYPDSFKRLGVRPPRGILLYGAPGTGKTLLAKAVATESEANFILIKGPELLSKWVGESEKAVRKIFHKARQTAPSIIFFDEIDSLAPRRGISNDSHVSDKVVNQILTEMDGLEDLTDVVVLAATNRPDMLDTALLRPGRFDRFILTPIPDEKTRFEIFKFHTKGIPINDYTIKKIKTESEKQSKEKLISRMAADEPVKEEEIKKISEKRIDESKLDKKEAFLLELAKKTEGYVGADIEAVCREAAILSLRENMESKFVTMKHFEQALKKVGPSGTKDIEKMYEDMQPQFKTARAKEMEKEKLSYMG